MSQAHLLRQKLAKAAQMLSPAGVCEGCLSKGPYAMDFELPSDAKPSELKLFGDYAYEDDAAVWNVS